MNDKVDLEHFSHLTQNFEHTPTPFAREQGKNAANIEISNSTRISRRRILQAGMGLAVAATGAGALFSVNRTNTEAKGQPPPPPHTPNVAIQWNNAALQAIRDTKPAPTVVARALAITHTCMYDAWAVYDHKALGTRLGDSLRYHGHVGPDDTSKAVSYAAYRALVDLFPSELSNLNALMGSLGYDPNDLSTDTTTPQGIGNVTSQAVITYRHSDGSNQLGNLNPGAYTDYTGYTPVNDPTHINDPNRWQPLSVSDGNGGFITQKYATPFWGQVTPFALSSGSQFRPNNVLLYPQSGYTDQANQILSYSAGLNDTTKVIADYWADGPHSELPPGHWNLFAQFVSQRDNHSLDDDVKMFFALTNALFDCSIAAWDCKRASDSVRPITAVHFLFTGQQVQAWAGPGLGTQSIDGGSWMPYQQATVVTPPFAEYVSGHSTFSAAGALILNMVTGSDQFGGSYTAQPGSSRIEPGIAPTTPITLSWAHFSDAAIEAGLSRRYGGIHFQQADLDGRVLGVEVGFQAWSKAQSYINGGKGH